MGSPGLKKYCSALHRLLALPALGIGALLIAGAMQAAEPMEPGRTNELRIGQFLKWVLERNESVHARVLEYEIAEKKLKGERWVFEPDLVLSYDRVENKRENTAEQRRSSGVVFFDERNNLYSAGLEALVPTGARVRLGYTLRDLDNNLQDPTVGTIVDRRIRGEFQTFAGISLTQPVLKNAWFSATMANIRLAALASDVAYQEYRRQLMLIVSTAEAAYWNLYLAQEQVRFFRDSVALAEALVAENEAKVGAGKAAELEVLEARAGAALRRSKLAEAEQKYYETVTQLLTLVSQSAVGGTPQLWAADKPGREDALPVFAEIGRKALEMNPDYLGQIKKMKQEDIRVSYAKNQRLPQLDLKASYGLNGLGPDPGSSWDDVQSRGFPSFSAGLELRLPLAGGVKGRRDLDAAKLRKQQALVTLKETEVQILNAIDTAMHKVNSARDSAGNYETVVAFNRNLLATERARLEAGKVSSRRVLEVDASLFEARNSVVEAQVQYERARLELDLVQGTVLSSRDLDLPQKELERRTGSLLKHLGISDEQYRELAHELQRRYDARPAQPGVTGGSPQPGAK